MTAVNTYFLIFFLFWTSLYVDMHVAKIFTVCAVRPQRVRVPYLVCVCVLCVVCCARVCCWLWAGFWLWLWLPFLVCCFSMGFWFIDARFLPQCEHIAYFVWPRHEIDELCPLPVTCLNGSNGCLQLGTGIASAARSWAERQGKVDVAFTSWQRRKQIVATGSVHKYKGLQNGGRGRDRSFVPHGGWATRITFLVSELIDSYGNVAWHSARWAQYWILSPTDSEPSLNYKHHQLRSLVIVN